MVKKKHVDKAALKNRKIRIWLFCCVWLVGAVTVWQGGFLGYWILDKAIPHFLPADIDDGFFVTKITVENLPVVPERGLCVSVSPQQLKSLLRDANPLFSLIPPGIIKDNIVLHGKWDSEKAAAEYSVPISINLSKESGNRPRIIFRYPVKDLNLILQAELEEDWRDEDEYFLGTYSTEQRIWFDSMSVKSIRRTSNLADAPIILTIIASGRLRYNVKDGFFAARITAKIKKLSGVVTLIPELHSKGVGFKYSCEVDDLDISVKKMAPWLEKKFADDLKDSIQRSLNKRKRRREFAKMRIPYWVPLDTDIDIKLME